MEAVTILRELWRRRALVAVIASVSVLIGLTIAYTVSFPPKSRKFEVGIASGRILVDTPDSQVVDVQPKGSGTLGIRAGVLANVMTEGDVKEAIARRAGLRPNQLRAAVKVEGELPPVLAKASGSRGAHLLITSPAANPDGTPLPMIDIEAQAPGTQDAARLADAAVGGLKDYLDAKASGEDVPDGKRLQVTGFGAPEVREETRGPSRLMAAAVTIFVFVLGCVAILVVVPLVRGWREAASAEKQVPDEEPTAESPPAAAEPLVWPTRLVGGLKRSPDGREPKRAVTLVGGKGAPSGNGDQPSRNGHGNEPSRNGNAEPAETV